jgi:hypothetical protein
VVVDHDGRAILRNLFYNGETTEIIVPVAGGVGVVRAWILDWKACTLDEGSHQRIVLFWRGHNDWFVGSILRCRGTRVGRRRRMMGARGWRRRRRRSHSGGVG